MLNLLKTALFSSGVEEEADEGIKDLIEMTMKKMDDDKDGKVSFEDFQICVRNNPLMLEAFGPCLPTGKVFPDKYIGLPKSLLILNFIKYSLVKKKAMCIVSILFLGWRAILQQHPGGLEVNINIEVLFPIQQYYERRIIKQKQLFSNSRYSLSYLFHSSFD